MKALVYLALFGTDDEIEEAAAESSAEDRSNEDRDRGDWRDES